MMNDEGWMDGRRFKRGCWSFNLSEILIEDKFFFPRIRRSNKSTWVIQKSLIFASIRVFIIFLWHDRQGDEVSSSSISVKRDNCTIPNVIEFINWADSQLTSSYFTTLEPSIPKYYYPYNRNRQPCPWWSPHRRKRDSTRPRASPHWGAQSCALSP